MRGLAIALLAGLLAVAAPSAQAICAVDAEGGCSALPHSLDLVVADGCPADEPLCILDQDGNLSGAPNGSEWDIVVRNSLGSAVTLEVFAIGFYDPETGEPVTGDRVAAQLLGSLDIPAGGSASLDDVYVPGNVSHVRLQAMSADGKEGEVDAELSNIRIMMMQPGDGPVDEDPQGEEVPAGEDQPQPEGKDAPAPGFLLAVLALGALALVAGFRRD